MSYGLTTYREYVIGPGEQGTQPCDTTPLALDYWQRAYSKPERRPLSLLLELPAAFGTRAFPLAAAAFPLPPLAPYQPHVVSRFSVWSWERQDAHSFSRWQHTTWDELPPRAISSGVGYTLRHNNYCKRRSFAWLWSGVKTVVLPAATGKFNRGREFRRAALVALDTIVARCGFRDMEFMTEAAETLAQGDTRRLLALLPQSAPILTATQYVAIRGPNRTHFEGWLPSEMAECDAGLQR